MLCYLCETNTLTRIKTKVKGQPHEKVSSISTPQTGKKIL